MKTELVTLLCFSIALVNCVGHKKLIDSEDENANNVAQFVVNYINNRDGKSAKLNKLVKVEKQIVAGYKWYITLDLENLQHPLQRCSAEVVEQSWLKKMEVQSLECSDQPTTLHYQSDDDQQIPLRDGGMVGGASNVDSDDEGLQAATKFAVSALNQQSNSLYRNMLLKTVKGTQQVVAGMMYRISFQWGESECMRDSSTDDATLDDCPVAQDKRVEECDVSVWDQAWRTPRYTLEKFNCHPASARHKRDVYIMQQHVEEEISISEQKPWHRYNDDDVQQHAKQFHDFKARYNKQYVNKQEEEQRFGIFHKNMRKVRFLQETEQGSGQYGATKFADLEEDEFRKNYLTPQWDLSYNPKLKKAKIPKTKAPDAFDWREHNAVTEVKNQGSCGSCWAFSTTGNIEGQWALKKKQLVSLSEQELVDCDKLDQGCGGGLPSQAYQEIMRLGGLEGEKDYPYEGKNDKCELVKRDIRVYINGSVNITKDEGEMAQWLAQNGPISIGINAFAMQFYFGGISHPWSIFCSPSALDHGVLIVGYGSKDGEPYWIVKNSWGKTWGEQGYYLVYRGSGVCGLNQMCTSAVVK